MIEPIDAELYDGEIKYCPFCGAAVQLGLRVEYAGCRCDDYSVVITCACGIEMPGFVSCFDSLGREEIKEEIKKLCNKWNRRIKCK